MVRPQAEPDRRQPASHRLHTYFYEPSKGHGLPRSPFKAIVAPRPIGWISTISSERQVNLAPYSFFNAFCESPPIVGFGRAGANRFGAKRPGIRGVRRESRDDLAGREDESDLAQAASWRKRDGPGRPGAAASTLVRAPRVASTPAALECKVTSILHLQDHAGRKVDSFLVLGELVGVHIDPAFLKDGLFDTAAARPIARCGYRGDYAEVRSLFEMIRPTMLPAAR
jgi:flavin reductase (DIM6/NTAB) family NADH-FMN oxidoreductase RutF